MKLAVLISAYHKLNLLDFIVNRLKAIGVDDIYLQLDAKCEEAVSNYVSNNTIILTPLRRAGWGAWTVMDNILNGYLDIIRIDSNVTHIWLCSGEDLIIRKPKIECDYNYISWIDNSISVKNSLKYTYNVQEGEPYPTTAKKNFTKLELDDNKSGFSNYFRGQTWTILSTSTIIKMYEYWNNHLEFWKIRGLDEEIFPATYCMNFNKDNTINSHNVYQEYNKSGCHPIQLSNKDFESIYNSDSITARKCSTVKTQEAWNKFMEGKL